MKFQRTIQIPNGWCHQGSAFIMSANLEELAVATGLEGQCSSQFPWRVVPKNVLTFVQLHSSPMLVRSCLKSCMIGFSIMRTKTSRCPIWFRKGRGTRDQIANIRWIIEKERGFQKNIYHCFINYTKAFECVDHDKLWKAIREIRLPDHLTCILRKTCMWVKKQVRTLYGTTDQFKIEKGVQQGCLLSPCLLNLHTERITRNARLDELQARIKIGRRNISIPTCMIPL